MYQGYRIKTLTPDLCSQLKKEKWETCHPSGDKTESLPVCSIDMDEEMLLELYQAHSKCNDLRVIENVSPCFSSKDKGHIKAQLQQKQMADTCFDLWQEKQNPQKQTQQQQQQVKKKLSKAEKEQLERERIEKERIEMERLEKVKRIEELKQLALEKEQELKQIQNELYEEGYEDEYEEKENVFDSYESEKETNSLDFIDVPDELGENGQFDFIDKKEEKEEKEKHKKTPWWYYLMIMVIVLVLLSAFIYIFLYKI